MTRTCLSVNVNKVAVIRNSRGGLEPDVVRAAATVIDAGADGITVHPRPDARHIRPDDVRALARLCSGRVEFNVEGNPFAPPRGDYPGLVALCEQVRPEQVTLVPDGDGQITSDHGFDLDRDADRLAPLVAALRELGCRVSLFIDAGTSDLSRASAIGAQRIEIYTGPYAHAHAQGAVDAALADCRATARAAEAAGLGVNAGHDLNQENLAAFLLEVGGVAEVSIGHALVSEALYDGLEHTVKRYLQIIAGAGGG
ncbi:pyridoxine 5'-phosphate synthase [Alkalisalibacterium limincola]|uniref:Pyridoxine 5'-phosphate synthase n=1 Tax=Alkalisalibacterium limincola TaxID=2699169 RepID=A0A5C8KN01_9GAMM|nr:pyridoxine 5'-phosphate synthase [Alkalisalibacterium limincola]TXK60704.1 pyridoxine 5'-phosphate synthase [Alkalisalibacterium limincola]